MFRTSEGMCGNVGPHCGNLRKCPVDNHVLLWASRWSGRWVTWNKSLRPLKNRREICKRKTGTTTILPECVAASVSKNEGARLHFLEPKVATHNFSCDTLTADLTCCRSYWLICHLYTSRKVDWTSTRLCLHQRKFWSFFSPYTETFEEKTTMKILLTKQVLFVWKKKTFLSKPATKATFDRLTQVKKILSITVENAGELRWSKVWIIPLDCRKFEEKPTLDKLWINWYFGWGFCLADIIRLFHLNCEWIRITCLDLAWPTCPLNLSDVDETEKI